MNRLFQGNKVVIVVDDCSRIFIIKHGFYIWCDRKKNKIQLIKKKNVWMIAGLVVFWKFIDHNHIHVLTKSIDRHIDIVFNIMFWIIWKKNHCVNRMRFFIQRSICRVMSENVHYNRIRLSSIMNIITIQ